MRKKNLPDMQNTVDKRGVSIDWVGITNYKVPFKVRMKSGGTQDTVGTIKIESNLSATTKGANMSRYSQIIETSLEKTCLDNKLLKDMLRACRTKLEADSARIIISFPFFLVKKAPVSKITSHFYYDCSLCGELRKRNDKIKIYLDVKVNYTSCCPCSKEMSLVRKERNYGRGAHNQRSAAMVRVKFKHLTKPVWIEDIAEIVESSASCPIYNSLKRPDEKYVTERAYTNPVFVEDMVRNVALSLDKLREISGYIIEIEHYESIHQANAIAKIKSGM